MVSYRNRTSSVLARRCERLGLRSLRDLKSSLRELHKASFVVLRTFSRFPSSTFSRPPAALRRLKLPPRRDFTQNRIAICASVFGLRTNRVRANYHFALERCAAVTFKARCSSFYFVSLAFRHRRLVPSTAQPLRYPPRSHARDCLRPLLRRLTPAVPAASAASASRLHPFAVCVQACCFQPLRFSSLRSYAEFAHGVR